MPLLSLPQTVLAFRYLWVSRFLRLLNSICHRRLVCQACDPLSPLTCPLSPLLSLSSCLQLLLGLVSSSAPPLKALEFYCSERLRKHLTTKESVRRLRGSVSQILISDLVRTSSAPRSNLVKIAASQNPTRRGFGKALQWSAAWSAAAAAVVACAAASELVHFDHRCANRISTWRKIMSGGSGVPCGRHKF